MEPKKKGRPSQDKVIRPYTIDRKVAEYIDNLPDGDRSRFVNSILVESIAKERAYKMRNIIESSEYRTAKAEYNGMYTVVDGSLQDGNFTIKTGAEGMPPTEYQEVSGIEAAVKVIQDKGLLDEDWEPLGEDA